MADFFKFLRGGGGSQSAVQTAEAERISRRSAGLNELSKSLSRLDGQAVLDLGPTSPANISFFTGMGQRIYGEDVLLASRDQQYQTVGADGTSIIEIDRFLEENLNFDPETFDAVLLWDMPDYLPEQLVKPIVTRIHRIMKPSSLLLAFFHTRDAGPDAPFQRYHISGMDSIDLQRIPLPRAGAEPAGRYAHFRLQRVFNNRHIENLFHDFASIKFFLGRDNIREVLVVR